MTQISDFTHQVLPGAMTDMTATYEVVHVLFIRPDVAAVKVRQRYLTLDGEQIGNEGTPMYVMAKEDGRWLLDREPEHRGARLGNGLKLGAGGHERGPVPGQ